MSIGAIIGTVVTEIATTAIQNRQGETIKDLKAQLAKWRKRAINFENQFVALQKQADVAATAAADRVRAQSQEILRLKSDLQTMKAARELGVEVIDGDPYGEVGQPGSQKKQWCEWELRDNKNPMWVSDCGTYFNPELNPPHSMVCPTCERRIVIKGGKVPSSPTETTEP